MELLILLIILLLLFGGGGFYTRRRTTVIAPGDPGPSFALSNLLYILAAIVIIVLVLRFLGVA